MIPKFFSTPVTLLLCHVDVVAEVQLAKTDTQEAALNLLESIKRYWQERGYHVEGWIKNAGYSDRLRATVFEVETNLVSGLPPSHCRIAKCASTETAIDA